MRLTLNSNWRFRIVHLALILIILIGITSFTEPIDESYNAVTMIDPQDTFPVPQNIPNQLYYLQRTSNTNTVVYALNIKKDGNLDVDNPVKVFWIRYPEGGVQKDLSFIQRKFAYGVTHKDKGDGSYTVNMVAYKKHNLTLMKSVLDNKYHMYTLINNRYAILNRVFIRIDPGGSLFKPNVIYIELKGTDMENGKVIIERIKP